MQGDLSALLAYYPWKNYQSIVLRQDGKQPDGLILIPWQGGKSLAWDVTVVNTLAQSYVDKAAIGVEIVAELAAEQKSTKYNILSSNFTCILLCCCGEFSIVQRLVSIACGCS